MRTRERGLGLSDFSLVCSAFLFFGLLGAEPQAFELSYTLNSFYFLFGNRVLLTCRVTQARLKLEILLPQPT